MIEAGSVIYTKLSFPRIQPHTVSRYRLFQVLERGISAKLTLVTAPAGYGKTTLVMDWMKDRKDAAWLSLDAQDSSLYGFWSHVVAAIDSLYAGFSKKIAPFYEHLNPESYHAFIHELIKHLDKREEAFILVLDDYHFIYHPFIDDSLSYFLERMPQHMHIFLLTRIEPRFSTSRFLVRGELHKLSAQDLAFNEEESILFYRLMNLGLTDPLIHQINQRTEGWAAGMKLAGLAIQDKKDLNDVLTAILGSQRYIADYFFEEVFSHYPERIQRFLLQTSLLSQMNSSLCEAVTGDLDSQTLLEWLERNQLFIVALDQHRAWFRYHHLFAEFLQNKLIRLSPENLDHLHVRCGDWWKKNDHLQEAIQHYLQGKDYGKALQGIEENMPKLLNLHRETLARWLESMPLEILEEKPNIYVVRTFCIVLSGNREEAMSEIKRAEDYCQRFQERQGEKLQGLEGDIALIKGYALEYYNFDLDVSIQYAQEYFAKKKSDSLLRHLEINTGEISILRSVTGFGNQIEKMENYLIQLLNLWREENDSPYTANFCTGISECIYERNSLYEAEPFAREAYQSGNRLSSIHLVVPSAVMLSQIYRARGEQEAFEKMVEEMREFMRPISSSLWRDNFEAFLLRQNIGNVEESVLEQWLGGMSWLSMDKLQPIHFYLAITRIRVLGKLGRLKEAYGQLERLLSIAEIQERFGEQMELLLIQGLLKWGEGELESGHRLLVKVLTLGEKYHYLRMFIDEGEPMKSWLLEYLKARQMNYSHDAEEPSLSYLKKLIACFRWEVGLAANLQDRVEILAMFTPKEHEVLKYLMTDMPNRQIAEQLNITVGTLKTHLNHIYSKLNVQTRLQAMQKWNKLNL